MNNPNHEQEQAPDIRAAIFVDYENLFHVLQQLLPSESRPGEYITEIIEELQRYLTSQDQKQTVLISAFADFGRMPDGQALQRSLYLLGAEPRFAPVALQANASEIQLSVDAMDILHTRPDVQTVAIVTGDRAYLPLVQQYRRHGRDAFVATLLMSSSPSELPPAEDDFFLDARNLLSEGARRHLEDTEGVNHRPEAGAPLSNQRVAGDRTQQALEVIEEHFGQYDEVYLTPLLRKLSELLGPGADPKSVISRLEKTEAVRLEKRQGSPHDYTVLIVNDRHPDVRKTHESIYGAVSDAAHNEFDGANAYREEGDGSSSPHVQDGTDGRTSVDNGLPNATDLDPGGEQTDEGNVPSLP